MATLSEVSFYTRRMIKWGAVIFFILLISPVVLRGAQQLYLILRPPPPPPPTVKYGKLPGLYFPPADPNYKPQYTLQTVDGKLPTTATQNKVYLVQINESRLLVLDQFKPKAAILGFTNDPVETEAGQIYTFSNPTLASTLTLDVISGELTYKKDWLQNQALFTAHNVPTNDQAFVEAKSFLTNLGLLADDLANGRPQYSYFKATPPTLTPVSSLSEANFVRLDIFRADLDKMPFVATDGNKSPVSLLFSGSQDQSQQIVELNYQYSKILDDNFATYPLKTVSQAWDELQKGGGYIAQKASTSVIVRKIYLAYYESSQPQLFLQPVFVFEGDNNFLAYIPAVTSDYSQ